MDPIPVSLGSLDPTTRGEDVSFGTTVVDNISFVGDCWFDLGTVDADYWTRMCVNERPSDGCQAIVTVHNFSDGGSHTIHTFYFNCCSSLHCDYTKTGFVRREGAGLGTYYFVGNYFAHTWEYA